MGNIIVLTLALALLAPKPGLSEELSPSIEVVLEQRELPSVLLCGKVASDAIKLFREKECPQDEQIANLILCRNEENYQLSVRGERCSSEERNLSRGQTAAILGVLPPRPVVVIDDLGAASSDGAVEPLAINKCGNAGCLCTGSFCADLIDANYCEDFKCASPQCLCVFPEED